MAHPLLENGQTLSRASGMLLCIAGGPELSMADVERIMEKIQRNSDQAHVIMGTAVDPDLADQIVVTLVASASQDALSGASDEPAPNVSTITDEDAVVTERWTHPAPGDNPPSRYVAPAPEFSAEKAHELFLQSSGRSSAKMRSAHRMRHGQLPLEIVSKGRFEKSEPTLHRGEDLDVPTYIRRGVPLN
jgi:cell division protein FtsZ